jgi:argininosuccinate synthase
MRALTTPPPRARTHPTARQVIIDFKHGLPTQVTNMTDGKVVQGALNLFLYLNELGGKHGIGRMDVVENRFVGIKSRGVYETPAGTILRTAHLDLEGLVMDREVRRLRDLVTARFSDACYNGFWFSPEMNFMLHAIEKSQELVEGRVELSLFKGVAASRGRESPFSLYDKKLSSMDEEGGYNPLYAEGFIKINSIRLKAQHNLMQKIKTMKK